MTLPQTWQEGVIAQPPGPREAFPSLNTARARPLYHVTALPRVGNNPTYLVVHPVFVIPLPKCQLVDFPWIFST